MSWDAGIQAGGERSLPRFAKSLGNGRRTPRKPPRRLGMGASARSVGRIPDQGIDIVIVLLGGAAEIDVDAARPEFRRGDGARDIILARTFAGPDPARAAFTRTGAPPVMGPVRPGFGAGGDCCEPGG